jgi:hypothetical protein
MLFVLCSSFGCQLAEKENEGILPPNKFAQALVELCIIEAAQKQQALPVSYQKQPEKWTADALFRLQTDTAEFNRSYRYYFSHPEKMNLVLVEAQAIW